MGHVNYFDISHNLPLRKRETEQFWVKTALKVCVSVVENNVFIMFPSSDGGLQGSEAHYLKEGEHGCGYKRAREGLADSSGRNQPLRSHLSFAHLR